MVVLKCKIKLILLFTFEKKYMHCFKKSSTQKEYVRVGQ